MINKIPDDPRLPSLGGQDYSRQLNVRLYEIFALITQTVNAIISDDIPADRISIEPIPGLAASNAQEALEEIVETAEELGLAFNELASNAQWYGKSIGAPFPIFDHIVGAEIPPTTNSNFRFIKLTASDAYNTGVLVSETVTGSAPGVLATAVINLAGSPMNGQTVDLINTERDIIKAGLSGTKQGDASRNITGAVTSFYSPGIAGESGVLGAPIYGSSPAKIGVPGGDPGANYSINIDFSRQVPVANEFRPKSIGATMYMRIK